MNQSEIDPSYCFEKPISNRSFTPNQFSVFRENLETLVNVQKCKKWFQFAPNRDDKQDQTNFGQELVTKVMVSIEWLYDKIIMGNGIREKRINVLCKE